MESKYGWIFGIRYTNGETNVWLHPEMTHGDYIEKINPDRDAGRLELRVRYFPADLVDMDKNHRIIFTLLYKQIFADYIRMENVRLELAVHLAVLEMRRKFPLLSPKAAKLISNGTGIDETYQNFFPQCILAEHKIRELRRMVIKEFQKMDAEGLEASDAAISFLREVKTKIYEFDREKYQVKMGQGWSVKVPLVIGPDDQVSYLQQSPLGSTRLAEFNRIDEIVVDYDHDYRLMLTVKGAQEQLMLTCANQLELDNLGDLIDGYCRGARANKVSHILQLLIQYDVDMTHNTVTTEEIKLLPAVLYSVVYLPSSLLSHMWKI